MAYTPYAKKLLDPRWQRKRLEKLQECDFACESCGSSTNTLHVHHKAYFKGADPWAYDSNQLAVLCDECHEGLHTSKDLLADVVSRLPICGDSSREEIAYLIAGYARIDIPAPEGLVNEAAIDAGMSAKRAFWIALRDLLSGKGGA